MLRFIPFSKPPRTILLFCFIAILSLSPFANLAQADAGDLDPTFGNGGKVVDTVSTGAVIWHCITQHLTGE